MNIESEDIPVEVDLDRAAEAAASAIGGEADPAPGEPTPEQRIADLQTQVTQWKDKALRAAADLDNFRKRTQRERQEQALYAATPALREILPVFDNLERAVSSMTPETPAQTVIDGVKMVLGMFRQTFGQLNAQLIDARGKTFDPNLHEAVDQVHSDTAPAGAVVVQHSFGVKLADRLIRPAVVVISKGPHEPPAGDSPAESPAPEPAAPAASGNDAG